MDKTKLVEKIPFKSKFWVSCADGMIGALNGLVTAGLSYFFIVKLGLRVELSATVWLIFAFWNAFNDPLFGYISDKTKSKLGRRIPYIRYGAPIIAFLFIISWIQWPIGGSQAALFIQMLLSLFLFDTLYTAVASALYVMPFEMAVSNKARSGILIWKMIFSIISLGIPLVLWNIIRDLPKTQFNLIIIAIGVIAGVLVFISTFFYKENGYVKKEEQMPLFKSIGYCFKNKSFIVFEVISFSVIFIQTNLMAGLAYYFTHFANVPALLCYGSLAVGAIAGMAVWLINRDKFGVKKCTILMCGVFGIGALLMTFFGGNTIVATIGFLATGFGFSGGMYLIPIMNGDVIDFDESKTGKRREGIYAGVNSLITKPAISISNAVLPVIMTAFGYVFPAKNELGEMGELIVNQTQMATSGVLVSWMAIPAALLFICFGILFLYPLSGKKWDDTKNQLELIHKQKQEEFEQLVLQEQQLNETKN